MERAKRRKKRGKGLIWERLSTQRRRVGSCSMAGPCQEEVVAGVYALGWLGRAPRAPSGLVWLGAGTVHLLCFSVWSVALAGLCCRVASLVTAASLGCPAPAVLWS